MNNTISDSVVEKIRKLLALSTSDNQHESELALMHAKRLAASNDIDIALINIHAKQNTQEPIVKNEGINLGNRKSITQKYVSWILQDHFGVKIIYFGNRLRGMTMVLLGRKDKITIAEYVQNFLNREFMNLWRAYYSASGCDLSARDSYLMGLHRGLSGKLSNEQKAVETEKLSNQTAETQSCFALMVRNESEQLAKAVKDFFPRLRHATKTKFNGSFDGDALANGSVDGAKINLRPSLSSGCDCSRIGA